MTKILRIAVIFLAIASVTGCLQMNDITQQNRLSQLPPVEKQHYVDSRDWGAYKKIVTSNLHETIWILKIHNHLGIDIQQKKSILEWLDTIDIFNEEVRNEIGLFDLPLDYAIYRYVETYSELKSVLPSDRNTEILIYLTDTLKNIESDVSKYNFDTILWTCYTLNILDRELLEKSNILGLLRLEYNMGNIPLLNYYYLLCILGIEITEEEAEKLKSLEIYSNQTELQKVDQAYMIEYINKHYQLNKESVLASLQIDVSKTIDDYLELEENVDQQYLYKLIFASNYLIPEKEKIELSEFYNDIFSGNAWNTLDQTLDLTATILGIEILSDNNVNLKNKKINTYLQYRLNSISLLEENPTILSLELNQLAQGFDLIGNNESTQSIYKLTKNLIENLELEETNVIFLRNIIEINQISNKKDLYKYFPKETIELIRNQINKIDYKTNLLTLYHYSLISNFFDFEEVNKVIMRKYIHDYSKAVFSKYNGEGDLQSILLLIKLHYFLNITIDYRNAEEIIGHMQYENDFYRSGILSSIKNILKNVEISQ